MRGEAERLEAEAKALMERAKSVRRAQQNACPHPIAELVQAPYRKWLDFVEPPFRVCKLCGYAEEEWRCGSWKLGPGHYGELPQVSREEGYRLARGGVHANNPPERFGR